MLIRMQKTVEADKPGATIIPVIISSDKTQVTLFRNKSAYPVYMTIGNLPKSIRRKPSRQGQIERLGSQRVWTRSTQSKRLSLDHKLASRGHRRTPDLCFSQCTLPRTQGAIVQQLCIQAQDHSSLSDVRNCCYVLLHFIIRHTARLVHFRAPNSAYETRDAANA